MRKYFKSVEVRKRKAESRAKKRLEQAKLKRKELLANSREVIRDIINREIVSTRFSLDSTEDKYEEYMNWINDL